MNDFLLGLIFDIFNIPDGLQIVKLGKLWQEISVKTAVCIGRECISKTVIL